MQYQQGQYQPYAVEEQVLMLYAGTAKDASGKNWIRDYPVDAIQRYRDELLTYARRQHPETLKQVREKKVLDDELQGKLDQLLEGFRGEFAKLLELES